MVRILLMLQRMVRAPVNINVVVFLKILCVKIVARGPPKQLGRFPWSNFTASSTLPETNSQFAPENRPKRPKEERN